MSLNKEKILTIFESIDFWRIKDHPNILIAANFWEEDRFYAAKVFYKYMRKIDDLIDNYKAVNKYIDPGKQEEFTKFVAEWLMNLEKSTNNDSFQEELAQTVNTFRIPLWPMQDFARSMIYDINNNGFPTLKAFMEYSQGASVAPASIFVHLCGLNTINEKYTTPSFDVKKTATPCAVFSYLVHIIRDFQKDQQANLNYFADDFLLKYGLTRKQLGEFANGKPANSNLRNLIREYHNLADKYRLQTLDVLKKVKPLLQPRYQLSLEIIFNLYLMVFERINPDQGSFTSDELNPAPEETRKRVYETIMQFTSR